jgi:hypothetical protein
MIICLNVIIDSDSTAMWRGGGVCHLVLQRGGETHPE